MVSYSYTVTKTVADIRHQIIVLENFYIYNGKQENNPFESFKKIPGSWKNDLHLHH